MEAVENRRTLFVAGERVELWENPDFSFPTNETDLESCVQAERWVLVFNAMVLGAAGAAESQAC